MALSKFDTGARFKRQFLTFDGKSSKDFLLYLSAPGVYDSPEPDVETASVPGMNGDLVTENAKSGRRRYKNVDITYNAFFFNGLPAKTAAVKSWLLSPVGYKKLQDTYSPEFFRMATCTSAVSFDVTKNRSAEMELTFSCKPQRWSVEGQKAVALSESGQTIRNPYEFYAEPIIRVYGTDKGILMIGDESVTIYSFTDYVDLDCETHNAYNTSGFCNGTILSDDFPALAPGTNTITWSGGITSVEITPRWWTL